MDSFFDWNQKVEATRRRLPHWSQKRVIYFATFRLADSIPRPILEQWKERKDLWLAEHPEPRSESVQQEYHRLFTWTFQNFLDAGHGACLLAQQFHAQIVADALRFFDGQRYRLGEWVIMPNHVHALFQTIGDAEPAAVLHSWKSFTATAINKATGRTGQVWQHESYDRIVRSVTELARIETYIRENPQKKPEYESATHHG